MGDTWDVIEKVTGISKSEQKKIFEDLQKNGETLKNCNLHDFSIEIPQRNRLNKKWKCKNCGGIVDTSEKLWYENGLSHGSQKRGYNV